MIVEIEKPAASCLPALEYNERKVLRGVAELIGYANMESTAREEVFGLFEDRDRTRYFVSEKGFHASVNPSPEDTVDEDGMLDFIAGLMERLGYGEQPYLVYRHYDIEREHYHIVSTRIGPSRHKINNYYEQRRALAYMEEVAPRYGFSMVEKGARVLMRADLKEGTARGRIRRFDHGRAVREQLTEIFSGALTYDFQGVQQLSCILEDLGVGLSMVRADDHPLLTLQGMAGTGFPATEVFTEETLGLPLYEMMEESWRRSRGDHPRRSRERERVRGLSEFAFSISGSEGHFRNILRNKGIDVHFSRSAGDGRIFGITYVDHVTRTVFKGSELRSGVTPSAVAEALSSGRWRVERPSRGGRRVDRVRATREAVGREAVLLRDMSAAAVARLLEPALQPAGGSRTGRHYAEEGKEKGKKKGRTRGFRESFREKIG